MLLRRIGLLPTEKETGDTSYSGPLSNLNEEIMFNALKKEKLSDVGFRDEFRQLNRILETDIGERAFSSELSKIDHQKDSTALSRLLSSRGTDLYRPKLDLQKVFIASHPDSFVSLYQLNEISGMCTADGYADAYQELSARLKKTSIGVQIKEQINNLKRTKAGSTAVDFSRTDQYGNRIKLRDYCGKLVLLDFWGSWCVPCRQSHPHLKELYEKYKNKGFEIVAVANESKSKGK